MIITFGKRFIFCRNFFIPIPNVPGNICWGRKDMRKEREKGRVWGIQDSLWRRESFWVCVWLTDWLAARVKLVGSCHEGQFSQYVLSLTTNIKNFWCSWSLISHNVSYKRNAILSYFLHITLGGKENDFATKIPDVSSFSDFLRLKTFAREVSLEIFHFQIYYRFLLIPYLLFFVWFFVHFFPSSHLIIFISLTPSFQVQEQTVSFSVLFSLLFPFASLHFFTFLA